MSEHNSDIADMFKYMEICGKSIVKDSIGFECAVDEEDATKWITENYT